MQYRRFGRTELQVSVLGLGTGGPSQLGQGSGVPEDEAIRVVRRALDLGINLIDTAAAYRESQAILGKALRGVPRERYVMATKFSPEREEQVQPPGWLEESLNRSLEQLGTDCVDVFQFHGVRPHYYREVVDRFLPEARRQQERGKFRFLGISENFSTDGKHQTLQMALADDHFDTVMVGYNVLAPSAERLVFPLCQERDVGVMIMFAVRRVLSRQEKLEETIRDLKRRGLLARDALPDERPLDWLIRGDVRSMPSAAYKFATAHPAVSSVLSGTSNREHLEANVHAALGASLPQQDRDRILALFGHIEESVGN